MSKFNRTTTKPAVHSPIVTEQRASGKTFEGGPGYARDAKSELFLLAVSNMVGEDTFYEKAGDRDSRYAELVHAVAVADPQWMTGFLGWLRGEGNMRSASLVGALEAAKAMLGAKVPGSRQMISSVLQRADEPGEALAYWMSKYGRRLPMPIKRGVADAVQRLYNERCVTPDTLVLMRDLTWIRAGSLQVGDELVAFDEQVRSRIRGQAAKMRVATVTGMRTAKLETVRVRTDRGETSVSVDHQFVVSNKTRNREWRRAGDLQPGDRLIYFGAPWSVNDSRDAGWMAGFLDGEGYVSAKCVAVTQASGPTCEEAKRILKDLGFEFSVQPQKVRPGLRPLETLKVLGGRYESMRLLGTVRPVRLSRDRLWVDGNLVSKGPWVEVGSCWATVDAVDDLGVQENVTMSTSTATFIADGYLSHNSLLKYDTASKGFRFADVIDLVHPSPVTKQPGQVAIFKGWQGTLFKHALDRRHDRGEIPSSLTMLHLNAKLRENAARGEFGDLLDPDTLKAAGMTWEDVLSLAGSKLPKKDLWEALIPSLPFMAALRNLRNMDEAGVSDEMAAQLAARISDPEQVAKSRQFPFRFLSAYEQAPSLRWGHALDQALNHSLRNLPSLPGRTLILCDTSGSMESPISGKSKMAMVRVGAVFAVALAAKGEQVDLFGFADPRPFRHDVPKGAGVIREIDRFCKRVGEAGHGTDIAGSLRATYKGHDRVVLISDMQTIGGYYGQGVSQSVPASVPIYGFNLQGYEKAAIATGSGNRHEFGGLTDATFRMLPLLEAGKNATWPWVES